MITLEQQKANRKLWVEALRSGKYKQGTFCLRSEDNAYCCLGVLADIAGCEWDINEEASSFFVPNGGPNGDENENSVAPPKARDFVGLRTRNGEFSDSALSALNDGGKSFQKIADIIESEPYGLFAESA